MVDCRLNNLGEPGIVDIPKYRKLSLQNLVSEFGWTQFRDEFNHAQPFGAETDTRRDARQSF